MGGLAIIDSAMAVDLTRQLVARWPDLQPAHIPLLKQAGIEAIVSPGASSATGIELVPEQALEGAVTRGVWPGIRRAGKRPGWENDMFANASAEPWIDSNLYLAPLERALAGKPTPVIAYEAGPQTGLPPDRSVPFETLELALLEARVQGGNFILSLDPRFRAALLAGDGKALAAWQSLGRTAAWLRSQTNLFSLAPPPAITALVEPGPACAEIANLLYRRNGSPRLASAAAPPPPDPQRILVLSAASLKSIPDAVWRHAEAGSTVVIDSTAAIRPTWKRTKEEQDRDFFELGRGRVIAYKKRVADPSEFALDLIDLVGHRMRTARNWNARSSVVFATAGPGTGEALLTVVNYGDAQRDEVQTRIHGQYSQATLLRPESAPVTLKTAPRGLATEVFLPGLERVAVIRFRA